MRDVYGFDPQTDLCPAHPEWDQLTERERELWHAGYKAGYRDAEADHEHYAAQDA